MIYDEAGRRKYLTIKERQAFIEAVRKLPADERTFCLTLAFTGARISEVLALTPERIDLDAGVIIVESLKKRRQGVYRAIPVPWQLVSQLNAAHGIVAAQADTQRRSDRIWPWGRTTAWALVKGVMLSVGIAPIRAMPKALRHAFAVAALQMNVPLNIVQKWLGHARITTTAIYADAVGEEERALAQRTWTKYR
jgi:integrase